MSNTLKSKDLKRTPGTIKLLPECLAHPSDSCCLGRAVELVQMIFDLMSESPIKVLDPAF